MRVKTHWSVDPRDGMSRCGAGPGALPTRDGEQVTCLRCRLLVLRDSQREAKAAAARRLLDDCFGGSLDDQIVARVALETMRDYRLRLVP